MTNSLLKRLGINSLDDKLLLAFSTVLFLPILFDFITVITGGSSSTYTFIIYIGTLLLFFSKFSQVIKPTNVLLIFGLYLLFALNYILFPVSQPYISSTGFMLVCIYFIPIGFLFFTQIRNWSSFISILNKYSILAFAIGFYILFFTNIAIEKSDEALFTYMEFSYALLPFICASFAVFYKTRKKTALIVFILGLFEIISYGCRGAILSSVLFALLIILLNSRTNKILFSASIVLMLFIYLNLEAIANFLLSIDLFSNSYFLKHFVSGAMFESERSHIYDLCEIRMSKMGLDLSGFFGDRPFCGSVYPHNFVYEILMQFGWCFGLLILISYLLLIISCLKKRAFRESVLFILCALLLKYMLSGSYLLSGQFWIATSALIAISTSKNLDLILNEYTCNFFDLSRALQLWYN